MKTRLILTVLLSCTLLAVQTPARSASAPANGYKIHIPVVLGSTIPSTPWITILDDDFETDTGAWQFSDESDQDGGEYYPGRRMCWPNRGSYSVWMVGGGADGAALGCGANYPNNVNSWMTHGPFSLVGATEAELRFDVWVNEAYGDHFCYAVSTGGPDWDALCIYYPSTSWTTLTLDLANDLQTSVLGEPEVWIAFIFQSDANDQAPDGVFVDNVLLRKCTQPACPPPP